MIFRKYLDFFYLKITLFTDAYIYRKFSSRELRKGLQKTEKDVTSF